MKRSAYTLRFIEMLLVLIKGKTSLVDALHILSREDIDAPIRSCAAQVLTSMKKGNNFSECLEEVSSGTISFAPFYITLIRASEMIGNIEQALENIAGDLRRKKAAGEHILGILIYPVVIIIAACVGTAVILLKGLPLFQQAGFLSDMVLESARAGVVYAGVFLFASGGVLLTVYFRIFGKDSEEFRIFYLLSFLLGSNISFRDALSHCILSMGESKYGRALAAVRKDISGGVRIAEAFARSGIFSSYVTGWLLIADENGNIAETSRNISDYYNGKDERLRNTAARFIEPAVIIITGIYLLILMQTIILPVLTRAGGLL